LLLAFRFPEFHIQGLARLSKMLSSTQLITHMHATTSAQALCDLLIDAAKELQLDDGETK